MHAGEPGSRLRDCAASADLSLLLYALFDSTVALLDMATSKQRHLLQVSLHQC